MGMVWCAEASLVDPGFDQPRPGLSPPFYYTYVSGQYKGGPASAVGWDLYNNAATTTKSYLYNNEGGKRIYITTGGAGCGLGQIFPAVVNATASVDVFVTGSGKVALYLYANGGTLMLGSAVSTKNNSWETLKLTLTGGKTTDELVLYSYGGGADFYADHASVVPEPGTWWAGLGAGLSLLGVARRAKRA